jgi:hypothetical protein
MICIAISVIPTPMMIPMPPHAGEDGRLDQELPHDCRARRADSLTDADLTRPFGDRDKHDIGNPDSPHEK